MRCQIVYISWFLGTWIMNMRSHIKTCVCVCPWYQNIRRPYKARGASPLKLYMPSHVLISWPNTPARFWYITWKSWKEMHTSAPLPSPLTVTISKLKLIKYIYMSVKAKSQVFSLYYIPLTMKVYFKTRRSLITVSRYLVWFQSYKGLKLSESSARTVYIVNQNRLNLNLKSIRID